MQKMQKIYKELCGISAGLAQLGIMLENQQNICTKSVKGSADCLRMIAKYLQNKIHPGKYLQNDLQSDSQKPIC